MSNRGTSFGRSSHGVVIILSFLLGSCQKLIMAKIDIGGQVLMAAHGCKWSHSFYNMDELQNDTNSNLFLEILYLLRFLLNDVRTSDIFYISKFICLVPDPRRFTPMIIILLKIIVFEARNDFFLNIKII